MSKSIEVPAKVREVQEHINSQETGSKSISFSQLTVYQNCPYCWYKTYILKEAPYKPSIHTGFGSSVHETIQNWLDVMYNQSDEAADEINLHEYLLERMRVNYGKDREAVGEDFATSKELQSFYQDGVAILDYVKFHRDEIFDTRSTWLVGCEIPLLFKLKDKFYFKGFIDILTFNEKTGIWKIWDIKTSTSGWNQSTKTDFLKTSQVLLYKHYLSQQFGIDPKNIEVEYFIVKRKIIQNAKYPSMTGRLQRFSPLSGPRVTKKAVSLVESFLSDTVQDSGEYQVREYKATPSSHSCKWCNFKDTCEFATV